MLAKNRNRFAFMLAAVIIGSTMLTFSYAQDQASDVAKLEAGLALLQKGDFQNADAKFKDVDPTLLDGTQRVQLQYAMMQLRDHLAAQPKVDAAAAAKAEAMAKAEAEAAAKKKADEQKALAQAEADKKAAVAATATAAATAKADADALAKQKAAEQKAMAEAEAKKKADAQKALAQAEATQKADAAAMAKQKADAAAMAKNKAADEKAMADAKAAETKAKAEAAKLAKVKAAEEIALAESQAKAKVQDQAEAEAKKQALAKAEAQANARAEAELAQAEEAKAKKADMAKAKADAAAAEKAAAVAAAEAAATAEAEAEARRIAEEEAFRKSLIQRSANLHQQNIIAEADQAATSGQYNNAIKLYEKALAVSENENARMGLEKAQAMLGRDANPNLMDDVVNQHNLRHEQAIATFNSSMDKAENEFNLGNYNIAQDAVSYGKIVIDTNRQFLAASEYDQMNALAASYLSQIQAKSEQKRLIDQHNTQQVVEAEQKQRRQEAEMESVKKIDELIRRTVDLQAELNYEEALEVLEQLLFIDPNNVSGNALKIMIEDAMIYRNQMKINRKRLYNAALHSTELQEASIAQVEIVQYPADWPQLSANRIGQLSGSTAETEVDRGVREKLDTAIPVSFDSDPFSSVIEVLRNYTNVNFFVNWGALEGAGIEQGSIVTLTLDQVPASTALRLILDQLGGDLVPLDYTIADGVVTISTSESISKNTNILTYDIRDLLVRVPNFDQAPDFDLQSISQSGGGGGGGGGGSSGGSLFDDNEEDDEEEDDTERITAISDLIRETVDPDGWRTNGGLTSSMTEHNGTLIVNTTSTNHTEITSLLELLRETRALQISVEARFLLVDQNYLDEVGIDVDLTITDPGDKWGPISIANQTSLIAERQNTTVTGSFGSPDDGAGFRRGLEVTASFIDDLQVSILLRATQSSRRSTVLTAPRITFFNGQRAFVLVATQLSYISDLNPIVATRSVAFDPQVDVVQSGVVLDVEGTVSADRRYVTVTTQPSLARVVRLRQIPVFTSNPPPDPNEPVDPEGPTTGQTDFSTGIIEAPELEITQIRTTVSIPDRGTLLLGGQRLMADVDIESGIPIISKIPVINRLFTNRSTVKDERTLLLLIKPEILIQSEREQESFPGYDQTASTYGAINP